MSEPAQDLLRRLAVGDEHALGAVLALTPEGSAGAGGIEAQLTSGTKMLVRVAALLALDASTASLRWAVEQACCTGASDDEIAAVLMAVGSEIGLASLVAVAPRLALAIGYDIEVEGWDGC